MRPIHTLSSAEERFNVASSLAGLILVGWFVVLYLRTISEGLMDSWEVWSGWIFAASAAFLYSCSAIYHARRDAAAKARARLWDHTAIFVLIAGTYTPFALGPLRDKGGWILVIVVWSLAAAGIGFKCLGGLGLGKLSNALYLLMGWLGIFFAPAFLENIPGTTLLWIVGGGVIYTIGIGFYSAKKYPLTHCIWHGFVVAGTACHAWAVLLVSAVPRCLIDPNQ